MSIGDLRKFENFMSENIATHSSCGRFQFKFKNKIFNQSLNQSTNNFIHNIIK